MGESEAEFDATMGLAFLAADFCMEPETFPVFLAWAHGRGRAVPSNWTPELLAPLVENLKRLMYVAGSGALS